MEIEYFLKNRTRFINYFYQTASAPFLDTILAIEKGVAPYIPLYSEDGEPPYLDEWLDAKVGLETVGHNAISMLSSSLQLFLKSWVERLDINHGMTFKVDFKKDGWLQGYKEIFTEIGLDVSNCPANLNIIEQTTLARNRIQHPSQLTTLNTSYATSDLEKYPRPFFIQESESLLFNKDGKSWLIPPTIAPSTASISESIKQVDLLCEWLEGEYWNARNDKSS